VIAGASIGPGLCERVKIWRVRCCRTPGSLRVTTVDASVILWIIFSPFAALMAFLITYEEYSHHYPERGPAFREALRTFAVTLLVFLVLGIAVSFVLPVIVK
jgi:hypothetical protein